MLFHAINFRISRFSHEGVNPEMRRRSDCRYWIPAFAGMTEIIFYGLSF